MKQFVDGVTTKVVRLQCLKWGNSQVSWNNGAGGVPLFVCAQEYGVDLPLGLYICEVSCKIERCGTNVRVGFLENRGAVNYDNVASQSFPGTFGVLKYMFNDISISNVENNDFSYPGFFKKMFIYEKTEPGFVNYQLSFYQPSALNARIFPGSIVISFIRVN